LVKEKNPIGFDRKKISVQKGKNPKNPQLCRLKTRPNEELERNGLLQSISHARASVLRRNFFFEKFRPWTTFDPPTSRPYMDRSPIFFGQHAARRDEANGRGIERSKCSLDREKCQKP
jgi:hypothetical protein